MKKVLDDKIRAEHRQGGMFEFTKTGEYPNKLIITSTKYKVTWRIKIKEDILNVGSLKVKKVVVYNYQFDNNELMLQEVSDSMPISDWVLIEDMIVALVD